MEITGTIRQHRLIGRIRSDGGGTSPLPADYITSAEVIAGLTATETQSEIEIYTEVNE